MMSARRSQAGFTIIEVLIVLAIAGMIALLIFMAIPTLQRNARNSQRKTGASSILTALHTYALNNSGEMAPNCGGSDVDCLALNAIYHNEKIAYYNGDGGTSLIICNGSFSGGAIAYGDPGNATLCNARNPGSSNQARVSDVNTVYVYNRQRCDPQNPGAGTSQGAGFSDLVALFALERGGSGTTPQCFEI